MKEKTKTIIEEAREVVERLNHNVMSSDIESEHDDYQFYLVEGFIGCAITYGCNDCALWNSEDDDREYDYDNDVYCDLYEYIVCKMEDRCDVMKKVVKVIALRGK